MASYNRVNSSSSKDIFSVSDNTRRGAYKTDDDILKVENVDVGVAKNQINLYH